MFNVTCESICDLTYDYLQSRNCPVLFYTYSIDGEEFEDNMGRDENALAVLYEALKTKRPTTSQINTEKYADFFREQLQKGDVLHLTFSSGLTQSISNCYKAAEEVRRENVLLQVFISNIGLRVKEVQLLPVFVFKYKKPQQIPQNYQQLYRRAYYVN